MGSVPEDLKKILQPDEQVLLYVNEKFYHPKINIDSVAFTNVRVILRQPHSMRIRKNYTDYFYQDMANVVLEKGYLRSTIKCPLRFEGEPLVLKDIPNGDAEKAAVIMRRGISGPKGQPGPFQSPYQAPQSAPGAKGFCTKCGAALNPGQRFCGSCGAPV